MRRWQVVGELLRSGLYLILALATAGSAYTGAYYWSRQHAPVAVALSMLVPGYGALTVWLSTD